MNATTSTDMVLTAADPHDRGSARQTYSSALKLDLDFDECPNIGSPARSFNSSHLASAGYDLRDKLTRSGSNSGLISGLRADEDAEFKRLTGHDDSDDSASHSSLSSSSPANRQRAMTTEHDHEWPPNQNLDLNLNLNLETTRARSGLTEPVDASDNNNNNITSSPNDGDNDNDGGKSCHTLPPADPIELRFLVRRREAGALIGKKGSNIKRLRETFHESTFSIPDTGNGPERIVCITTKENAVDDILHDLTRLFLDKSPENDEQIELKLLIRSFHAGSIIGIGGQSIKKLRNDSKAAIKIYEMCCPLSNERVCAIKAKPSVVVNTIKLILVILNENPIKGTIKPYDALNFDLNISDKYGGYLPDECLPSEALPFYHPVVASHHHHHQNRACYFDSLSRKFHQPSTGIRPKDDPRDLCKDNARQMMDQLGGQSMNNSSKQAHPKQPDDHHHHHQTKTVERLKALPPPASSTARLSRFHPYAHHHQVPLDFFPSPQQHNRAASYLNRQALVQSSSPMVDTIGFSASTYDGFMRPQQHCVQAPTYHHPCGLRYSATGPRHPAALLAAPQPASDPLRCHHHHSHHHHHQARPCLCMFLPIVPDVIQTGPVAPMTVQATTTSMLSSNSSSSSSSSSSASSSAAVMNTTSTKSNGFGAPGGHIKAAYPSVIGAGYGRR